MGEVRALNARAGTVAVQGGGAIDEDCAACCTMQLPKYRIFVRSFHPNRMFNETEHIPGILLGGPWSGDSRGFSLSTDAKTTSRVMHSYLVDTAQMPLWFLTTNPTAESNVSHGTGYGFGLEGSYPRNVTRLVDLVQTSPYGRLYEVNGPQAHPDIRINTAGLKLLARSIPEAKVVRSDLLLDQPCRKSATIITHHFGVNLAVLPSASIASELVPDLDVFARVSFDVNRKARTLDIETTVFGDGFPNCEVFLEDAAKTRVFLGVSTRRGYPIGSLTQLFSWDRPSTLSGIHTKLMFKSQLRFALDESGALLRFSNGLSIKDWNERLIKLDPNSRSNSTEFEER